MKQTNNRYPETLIMGLSYIDANGLVEYTSLLMPQTVILVIIVVVINPEQ